MSWVDTRAWDWERTLTSYMVISLACLVSDSTDDMIKSTGGGGERE